MYTCILGKLIFMALNFVTFGISNDFIFTEITKSVTVNVNENKYKYINIDAKREKDKHV